MSRNKCDVSTRHESEDADAALLKFEEGGTSTEEIDGHTVVGAARCKGRAEYRRDPSWASRGLNDVLGVSVWSGSRNASHTTVEDGYSGEMRNCPQLPYPGMLPTFCALNGRFSCSDVRSASASLHRK